MVIKKQLFILFLILLCSFAAADYYNPTPVGGDTGWLYFSMILNESNFVTGNITSLQLQVGWNHISYPGTEQYLIENIIIKNETGGIINFTDAFKNENLKYNNLSIFNNTIQEYQGRNGTDYLYKYDSIYVYANKVINFTFVNVTGTPVDTNYTYSYIKIRYNGVDKYFNDAVTSGWVNGQMTYYDGGNKFIPLHNETLIPSRGYSIYLNQDNTQVIFDEILVIESTNDVLEDTINPELRDSAFTIISFFPIIIIVIIAGGILGLWMLSQGLSDGNFSLEWFQSLPLIILGGGFALVIFFVILFQLGLI